MRRKVRKNSVVAATISGAALRSRFGSAQRDASTAGARERERPSRQAPKPAKQGRS